MNKHLEGANSTTEQPTVVKAHPPTNLKGSPTYKVAFADNHQQQSVSAGIKLSELALVKY